MDFCMVTKGGAKDFLKTYRNFRASQTVAKNCSISGLFLRCVKKKDKIFFKYKKFPPHPPPLQ